MLPFIFGEVNLQLLKNKFLFSVFVWFIILVLLSLGFWQIYRLNWKLDLINQIEDSYEAALSSDPISAFGGILVSNTAINEKTAKLINNLYCEVVIAKKYEKESLKILSKKNLWIRSQK